MNTTPADTFAHAPVITIDGPSGVGKGTLSQRLAQVLEWHYLDSGALYRILALAALRHAIHHEADDELLALSRHLHVRFLEAPDRHAEIFLDDEIITQAIRSQEVGEYASRIAVRPHVRQSLLDWQRRFRQAPGLVADGRDMGTIIFPDAVLKIFLIASARERAERRQKQLREQGVSVNLPQLIRELEARDLRDSTRAVAPLKPAADAITVDTTGQAVSKSFEILHSLAKVALSRST